ncbi:MAG TPA: hypothetical protein VNK41_11440, partial [Vicinamibacterales bacterium]|nr:hypothetical protein [Vicinamibacterales bacterium]
MKRQLAATIAGALILIVVQGLTGALVVPVPVELPPRAGPWIIASNLLVAAVLAWIARRSAWNGWRLAVALFAIGFGIGSGVNL